MTNLPGGHQQSLLPATWRSSPGREPVKSASCLVDDGVNELFAGVAGGARWQPDATAIRRSRQARRTKCMNVAPIAGLASLRRRIKCGKECRQLAGQFRVVFA